MDLGEDCTDFDLYELTIESEKYQKELSKIK